MNYSQQSSQALMDICNRYFLTQEEVQAEQNGIPNFPYHQRDYTTYAKASNELAKRGMEICEWARTLLSHPDYDARELGGTLLGFLAERHQIGTIEDQIVDELCALATRPVEYDGKELQAVSAAINALGKIGNRRSIPTLKAVVFDTSDSDNQWQAAQALGKILHVSFDASDDPVATIQLLLNENNH